MPANWLVWDRIREFTRSNRIYQQERILQDQSSIDKLAVGGDFLDFSSQNAILQQTNLQINRLERYKDYEQMDQTGEISLALDLYADECYRGGTRIPLLDGTCPTLAELVPRSEFWVYAWDGSQYIPAKGYAARITKRQARFVRVQWNGGFLDVTPDHLFATRRGWVKARELVIGDSLVPFNMVRGCTPPPGCDHRVAQSIRRGYEAIQLADGQWIQTHKWVYQFFNGKLKTGYVIHHDDIRRFNNIPTNLKSLLWSEHKKLHEKVVRLPPEIEEKRRESVSLAIKAKWQDPAYREKMIPHCQDRGRQLCSSGNAFRGGSSPTSDWDIVCDLAAKLGCNLSQAALAAAAKISVATTQRMLSKHGISWEQFVDKHGTNGECEIPITCGYRERHTRTIRNCAKKMIARGLDVYDWEANRHALDQNVPSLATVNTCFGSIEALATEVGYNRVVESITALDIEEDAYDITVPGYDCFAVGTSDSWVIAHNCSLIDPEYKHSIIIRAANRRIKETLEELYFDTLLIDRWLRPAARYLCKFGDASFEIVTDRNRTGVSSLRFMDIYNFTRIETRYGDLVGFFYQDDIYPEPIFMHPWSCMHMRLTNFEAMYAPYGRAIIDGSRKPFKQLRLMEDASLIYRITRGPEKRKYKIPVGMIPPKEVPEYLMNIARMFKRQRFYNPTTGTFDERFSPIVQEDDFFLPQRPDGSGPDIDILPGGENMDKISDIEYFKKKMVSPLKIPFARVGIGEGAGEPNEKSLSQSDAEFAKAVQWVQSEIALSLQKVGIIHLALQGFSAQDIKGFSISLASSSALDDLYRMETWATRVGVMSDLKEIGWFPKTWIVTRFTDLSPDEIQEMEELAAEESGDKEDEEGGGGGGIGGPSLGIGDIGGDEDIGGEMGGEDIGDEMEDGGDEMDFGGGGGDEGEEGGGGEEGFELENRDDERRVITEIRRDANRKKRYNNIVKVSERAKRITSPYKYLLESKELDGLTKSCAGTPGEGTTSDKNVLVEWSVSLDDRREVINEVKSILKNQPTVSMDDADIDQNDLPT